MTSRSILLIFAALLLTASLAGVAVSSPAATPATSGIPAFLSPASTSPDCAKGELAFLNPAPSQQAGGALCGSCSETLCRGYTTGTVCGYKNGRNSTCQAVYGGTCTTGGLECSCWNGDLP